MKAFSNFNARSLSEAVSQARTELDAGKIIAFSGGGSDLLQQIKDGTSSPDVLINLRTATGADQIIMNADGLQIGGLARLVELAVSEQLGSAYTVLKEASASVGSPQIRNVGTLGGNISQRPWCWYYRNGFPCYKAGGSQCFSVTGENQLHAIFAGGPSYIVHPSDLAPALLALDAQIEILGPGGSRNVSAAEFFVLPAINPARENLLADDELVAAVRIPALSANTRSSYYKVMDRETWTHAVASAAVVLELQGEECVSARIVLGGVAPVPWPVPDAARLLTGQRITADLARRVGEAAVAGAQPLTKNAYKIPLVAGVIEQTIMKLAS